MVSVFILWTNGGFIRPVQADHGRTGQEAGFFPPKKIVSLIPTVTEELFLLDVDNRIVGVSAYCQRPPGARAKDRVGTVIEVNVEKLVALNPDLVIASNLADSKQLRKLENLGLKVKVFRQPRDFQELCDNFLILSRLVGEEEKAGTILAKAKAALEAIENDLQGVSRRRVFVQIGANPLFTANGESFLSDLIERAGGINIAGDAKQGIFSREEVIRRNPETILIVNMGIVGAKEKEVWLRYKTLRAVENRRIFMVDSYRVCSPTPVSFVDTVKEFVGIFHGEQ
jgi:iron complex transport system substrate-binding protein